jgi:hypothetical protein
MRSARLVERNVRFWEVEPRQDLLIDCGLDEAYVAARPGRKYVLFFTDGGSVGLKLADYAGVRFDLNWIDVSNGVTGATGQLLGGSIVTIHAPSDGPWVATITQQ